MRLDDTVVPTICAPRRIPIAMKDKVKAELDRMTALGVITPENDATEWVSAMVAAEKKRWNSATLHRPSASKPGPPQTPSSAQIN